MSKTTFVGRGWQKYHTDGENLEKYRSCSWKVSRLELDRRESAGSVCIVMTHQLWVPRLRWEQFTGLLDLPTTDGTGFFLFRQYEMENNF